VLSPQIHVPAGWPTPRVATLFGAEPSPHKSRALARTTILTVDDEADARDFLRISLTGEGFDVLEASSGIEALLLIARRRFDLAIIDVMMAGMTGLELCDELRTRRETREIPIILYSAYQMKKHSNAGLYDHAFVKPVDLSELVTAIRRLLPRTA
jgi:CheY-like chemotaxis protein